MSSSAAALTWIDDFRAAHFKPDVNGGSAVGVHTELGGEVGLEAAMCDLEFVSRRGPTASNW